MTRIPKSRPQFIWVYKDHEKERKPRASKATRSGSAARHAQQRTDNAASTDGRGRIATVDGGGPAQATSSFPDPHDVCNQSTTTLDPFNATAVNVHPSSTRILRTVMHRQNALSWGFCCDKPWQTDALRSGHTAGFLASLPAALTDQVHMASLLVFLIHCMRVDGVATVAGSAEAALRAFATQSLRTRLATGGHLGEQAAQDMLFDVAMLCASACLEDNAADALVHLKGSEGLVRAGGGLARIPDYLRDILLWVDYGMASSHVAAPIFHPPDVVLQSGRLPSGPDGTQAPGSIQWYTQNSSCFRALSDVAESLQECAKACNTELSRPSCA